MVVNKTVSGEINLSLSVYKVLAFPSAAALVRISTVLGMRT